MNYFIATVIWFKLITAIVNVNCLLTDSKTSYDNMHKYLLSNEFGSGNLTPVAYDTAWVARIPNATNPKQPAFPKSLQWIRDNQLMDGSWGENHTIYAADRLINTLSAVISLKQYNYEIDLKRIERGINAVNYYLNETNTEEETINFPMLLITLLNEAQVYGLKFNHSKFKFEQSLAEMYWSLLEQIHTNANTTHVKGPWIIFLECFNNTYQPSDYSYFADQNGLIGGSSSGTAFALIKNKSLTKSFNYIENLVNVNNGGLSSFPDIGNFDLIFSLHYILLSGFDVNDSSFKSQIDKLEKLWIKFNGSIPYGSGVPADADDMALALFVLSQTNRLTNSSSVNALLKFYINDVFYSFLVPPDSGVTTSISLSLHCLMGLKKFRGHNTTIDSVIEKTILWVNNEIENKKYSFADEYYYSPTYAMSAYVFAMEGIDNKKVSNVIQLMVSSQNLDGGWGVKNSSSLHETALVALSLSYWVRSGHNENRVDIINCVHRANGYLNSTDDFYQFYIGKVFYEFKPQAKATVLAAKYAISLII